MKVLHVFLIVLGLGFITALEAKDVPGWRGDGTGRFPAAQPPKTWSQDTNVIWKTSLPSRSYASPVLVNGRLFVMAEPSSVLCLDGQSGEILWKKEAGYREALGEARAEEIEAAHKKLEQERREINQEIKTLREADPDDPKLEPLKEKQKAVEDGRREYEKQFPQEKRGGAGNTAATPVFADGRVYVTFSTGIVAAFTDQGERLWIKHLEPPTLGFGGSASPVLADGKLIVHFQDLIALDPKTGEPVWRAKLPAKHGTPAVTRIAGRDILVTPSGALVRAADGEILKEKLFGLSENSPLVEDGVIYAHESGKIKALKLPRTLEEPIEVETLWETTATRDQRMASAVLHDGLLYAGTRRGLMDVVDAETGKILYRKRLDLGEIFSSVAVAGGQIFYGGRNGKTLVLNSGRDYDEVGINETDRYSSTPIFDGGRIYLRTEKFLYCIGE